MKIDFALIDQMVAAGTSAEAVVLMWKAHEAKRDERRTADRARKPSGKKWKSAEIDGNDRKVLDLKGQLYARAEQVCGAKVGGIVTRLLEANGGDVATVVAIVEQAAKAHRPRDYLTGTMKGSANGTIKGAFAELRFELGGEGDGGAGGAPMRDITPGRAGAG
jgi:hypothetical protein